MGLEYYVVDDRYRDDRDAMIVLHKAETIDEARRESRKMHDTVIVKIDTGEIVPLKNKSSSEQSKAA